MIFKSLGVSNGHTWLQPLYQFINFLLTLLTGATQYTYADLVQTFPLAANTYANGTSGVGATLTGNANGALSAIDSVTPKVGQVVLVAAEAAPANNGLYTITSIGSSTTPYVLTRVSGFDSSSAVLPNTLILVRFGTSHGTHVWQYTGAANPTIGTSALLFAGSPRPLLSRGSVASSRLAFSVNPANGNTVGIGSTTVQFVTTLGAATTNAQILIGANAAATLASLVNYINGVSDGTWVESTTPPTFTLFADAVTGTQLRVRNAMSRGNRPISGATSLALTATITSGASAWTLTNLSASGKFDTDSSVGIQKQTVGTVVASAVLVFEFQFVPSTYVVQVFSSAGVQRAYSDVTAISGNAVTVTLGGGATPNIQTGDIITVLAFQ